MWSCGHVAYPGRLDTNIPYRMQYVRIIFKNLQHRQISFSVESGTGGRTGGQADWRSVRRRRQEGATARRLLASRPDPAKDNVDAGGRSRTQAACVTTQVSDPCLSSFLLFFSSQSLPWRLISATDKMTSVVYRCTACLHGQQHKPRGQLLHSQPYGPVSSDFAIHAGKVCKGIARKVIIIKWHSDRTAL